MLNIKREGKMLRSTITAITIAAAASTASAGLVRQDITGTAPQGSGIFAPLPPMELLFSAQIDMSSSVLAPVVGNWTMTIASGGTTVYTASGTGFNALTYIRSGSTRKYIMVFNNTAAPAWQSLANAPLTPTLFEIGYTAAKTGAGYGSIGESLEASSSKGSGSPGFLMVITNSVPGQFGAMSSIGYAIPAPGAAVLFGLAGFVASRRRRS
jgi:hypothetical protein